MFAEQEYRVLHRGNFPDDNSFVLVDAVVLVGWCICIGVSPPSATQSVHYTTTPFRMPAALMLIVC